MKKYFLKIFFVMLMSGIVFGQNGDKITVAVLDFEGKGVAMTDASILADRFRNELVNTGKVSVVERGQMNTILEEIGFQQSGCTSSECLVEIGKVLNVQKMIGATVGKFSNIYTLDLRMIDVQTAEILSSISEDHEGEMSDLLAIMKDLAQKMAANATGAKIEVREEEGSNFWLWTAAGVAVAGAAAVLLTSGSDGGGASGDSNLPSPPDKP